MSSLFSIKFWFNSRPGLLTPGFEKTLIGVIVLFFLAGLFFYLVKRSKKYNIYNKVFDSLITFSFVNFVLGLVIWFFIYEMVPVLSSRFWFLFWAAEIVVWVFFIYRMLPEIKNRKATASVKKEYQKYIP